MITTPTGGAGVATFYSRGPLSLLPALQDFWSAMGVHMPTGVTMVTENSGDLIEDTDGSIIGSWAEAAPVPAGGQVVGSFAAPSGAVVTWLTTGIVHSHRVRGRTFIVPLAGTSYQADGTLQDATAAAMRIEAAAFVTATAGSLAVWSRPFAGTPATGTRPANPARLGSSFVVAGSSVKDKVAVLRSRRD